MFTQPIMYSIIEKHPNVLDLYSKKLIEQGVSTKEETQAVIDKYERICEEAFKKAAEETQVLLGSFRNWHFIFVLCRFSTNIGWTPPGQGSLKAKILWRLLKLESTRRHWYTLGEGLLRVLQMLQISRSTEPWRESWREGTRWWIKDRLTGPFAFGSLLKEGVHVRLSGQDVERGTACHSAK